MNYIKRLESELRQANQDKIAARKMVDSLIDYLALPKFHVDTTVQVKDILNRVIPMRIELI